MPILSLMRANMTTPIINALVGMGADQSSLLKLSELPLSSLSSPSQIIPGISLRKLWAAAEDIFPQSDLGFQVAERSKLEFLLPIADQVVRPNEPLSQALNHLCNAFYSEVSNPSLYVEQLDDGILLSNRGTRSITLGHEPLDQYSIAQYIYFIRLYLGEEWRPSRIEMRRSNTRFHIGEVIKGTVINCDRPVSSIFIESHYLDERPKALFKSHTQRPKLKAKSYTDTLLALLRSYYRDDTDGKLPSLGEMADLMAFHERKIQRMLKEEGNSYRKICNYFTIERAIKKLKRSHDSINSISDQLGYKHPEHFCRAFVKSMGISPQAFREKMKL